ncbi:PH domain-containing protein [Virgibacillus sp. 179-BFC.A HS]|uniref:PH domain-containing protein n=1 Tax=Tigheibacillus jepli TaxID=3035914 RepID=A0ABU5CES9_9BACI|nr:PH domain-containing protein [Virgibacillus sp. 179-BFC.A HS]MDY0404339.1 PH domain-containing protein [Virgibacillus sp. 179-BFC.A HS]
MMNEPRRLHPLAMVFMFGESVKNGLIPLLAVIFGAVRKSGAYGWLIWLVLSVLFVVFFILPSVLGWLRYHYWVEDGELRIEHGIFFKHHRYIRKERIQTINRSVNVLHRMFGLEKMNIETAGGSGEPEATLAAIKIEEGQRLEAAIYQKSENKSNEKKHEPGPQQLENETVDAEKHLSTKDLLIAGLTSGKIGVVLLIVGAIYSQVQQFIPDEFYEDTFHRLFASGIQFIVVIIVLIAFLAWLSAVMGTVLVYWRFILVRKGKELQTVSGLLERRRIVLPLHRIQALRIVDGILRQPFGFVTVYAESAGGTGNDKEGDSIILFPLLKRKDVPRFLEEFVPGYPTDMDVSPVPKRALYRYVIRILVPMAIVAAAIVIMGYFWFWPWGALAVLLLPIAYAIGYAHYHSAAWGTTDRFRMLRFRTLNRTTVIVPRRNIQTRTMRQSWFQKRGRLATYQLTVMSKMAGTGKKFQVKHLDKADVQELIEEQ